MTEKTPRKRLVKNSQNEEVDKIQKKSDNYFSSNDYCKRPDNYYDSKDYLRPTKEDKKFISKGIEYDSDVDGLASSSEESAHSTDSNVSNRPKRQREKRKRESKKKQEKNTSSSDEEDELRKSRKANNNQQILVGKKALDAKRKDNSGDPLSQSKPKAKNNKETSKSSKSKNNKSNGNGQESSRHQVKGKSKKQSSVKETEIVTEILKRWWYVLPEWPPKDFKYDKLLEENNLRLVNHSEDWNNIPNVDSEGRTKCIGIKGFPGVFRTVNWATFDLRPKDTCPSFNNLIKKSQSELKQLLSKAIQNQKKQLDENDKNFPRIVKQLDSLIAKIKI